MPPDSGKCVAQKNIIMDAKSLREKTIENCSEEITETEAIMKKESEKGSMHILIGGLSEGARQYFIDNGFDIKLTLQDKDDGKSKYKIMW